MSHRPCYHPKVGDTVITRYYFDGERRIAVVDRIDGWYVYIICDDGVELEVYPSEIDLFMGSAPPNSCS